MKNSDTSYVSIVIVARDRYSTLPACVESVLQNTGDVPFRILIVEGNSGEKSRSYLRALSANNPAISVLFHDKALPEEAARDIALGSVQTKWVAFLDSDAEVYAGWLSALLQCGEEENAAIVSPLILENRKHVHAAACFFDFEQINGERVLSKRMMYFRRRLNNLPDLVREQSDFAETHGFLVNRNLLPDRTLFDTFPCDFDLAMKIRERKLRLFFEPKARINFNPPPPLQEMDFEQFALKWGGIHEQFDDLLANFNKKWNVRFHPNGHHSMKAVHHYYRSMLTPMMEKYPSPLVINAHNFVNRILFNAKLFARDVISVIEKIVKGKSREFVR